MLGMGVILNYLGGNDQTAKAVQSSYGKVIKSVSCANDRLVFQFEDGTWLRLHDGGQSCCEHRYMNCDDDLSAFVGAKLTKLELQEAPEVPNEWGEHEVQFLAAITDKGTFKVSNHNEHNGYYGGFSIAADNTEEVA